MNRKYLAFDLEIAKDIPDGETDWKANRPLGITCAAALSRPLAEASWLWYAHEGGHFKPFVYHSQAQQIVKHLQALTTAGYTILTWNGLSFDFDILAEESLMYAECQALALNHIDMMFHFFCANGYPLGLDAAAKGMGLAGKAEGMDGALAPQLWAEGQYTKVLDYVNQDVANTLNLALAVERAGRLDWTARSGRANTWPCDRWLTVREAMTLPEPDTSWMTEPWPRTKFYEWIGEKA